MTGTYKIYSMAEMDKIVQNIFYQKKITFIIIFSPTLDQIVDKFIIADNTIQAINQKINLWTQKKKNYVDGNPCQGSSETVMASKFLMGDYLSTEQYRILEDKLVKYQINHRDKAFKKFFSEVCCLPLTTKIEALYHEDFNVGYYKYGEHQFYIVQDHSVWRLDDQALQEETQQVLELLPVEYQKFFDVDNFQDYCQQMLAPRYRIACDGQEYTVDLDDITYKIYKIE